MSATVYDVVIIGAGPAGMTAAVYCARKQLSTLILTKDVGGQTAFSSDIENYLGFSFIRGADLVSRFEEHLKHFPVDVGYEEVVSLEKSDAVFATRTRPGRDYRSESVIIASGKMPRKLGVEGEDEFVRRGVTYCATCDAPLFPEKDVAVVGGGNSGIDAAIQLTKIANKIYVIEYARELKADAVLVDKAKAAGNVEFLTSHSVTGIYGDMLVTHIGIRDKRTRTERELNVQGVFIEIGLIPNTGFVSQEVTRNKWNEIVVDKACRTNVEGLFSAGDVTDVPEKQIIVAAGEGAKAALSAYSYLVRHHMATVRTADDYE